MSAPVAEASNGLLSTVFEIAHPASIPSDGSDHKVGRLNRCTARGISTSIELGPRVRARTWALPVV